MKQISSKQLTALAFILIVAQKIFLLPTLLIKTGGRDSWISVAIFLAVEIGVLLLILCTLKMKPNMSFYSLAAKGAGRAGAKLIVAVMLFYLVIKAELLLGELRVFFNLTLAENLTDWLAFIPLCAWLVFVGTKTMRGLGRLAELLIPFIVLAMLLIVFLVSGNISFEWLRPVLENGLKPVMSNVLYYPMWFGDLSLLVIVLGQVKAGKHYVKTVSAAAIIGSLAVMFFSTVVFAAYADIPHLLDFSTNVSNMLLYSSSSYIYGRFDIPIFCVWIFCIFLQLAFVFYSAVRHVGFLLDSGNKAPNFKKNTVISASCAAIIYFLLVFIFKDEHTLFKFSTGFLRLFAVYNIAAVPVFIFVTALVLHLKESKNPQKMRLGYLPLLSGRRRAKK